MMDKGLRMQELFDSDVFNFKFDYDEWPTTSPIEDN